jgi:PilZ domain
MYQTISTTKNDESDRRAHRRLGPSELPTSTLIRIPDRPAISLVDLSAGGALLDLPFQLRPDSRITLQVVTPDEEIDVQFRLLRCFVADLNKGVRYYAAGRFDETLRLPGTSARGRKVDRIRSALEGFLRASDGALLGSRGARFNELVSRIVEGLRRGDPPDLLLEQIKYELIRLFPSLVIVPKPTSPLFDASTSARFFDLEFRSRRILTAEDRRFLRAGAQLITLIGTNVPAPMPPVPPPLIIHDIAQWQALSR